MAKLRPINQDPLSPLLYSIGMCEAQQNESLVRQKKQRALKSADIAGASQRGERRPYQRKEERSLNHHIGLPYLSNLLCSPIQPSTGHRAECPKGVDLSGSDGYELHTDARDRGVGDRQGIRMAAIKLKYLRTNTIP